nr:hypothetical protein CFP56_71623 [Quercus suber]
MVFRGQHAGDGSERFGLRVGRGVAGKNDESLADDGLAGGAEEGDGARDGVLEQALEDDEVGGLELVGRGIEHAGERLPPEAVGGRVSGFGAAEVTQGDGGEAGAEAEEALVVLGLREVRPGRGGESILAHPAEPCAAGGGLRAARDAEDERAAAVEFGPEKVDQRDAVEVVLRFAEDDDRQDAERVRGQAVDGTLGDELPDDAFGEMVKEKQEDSRTLGRRGCVALRGGFLWVVHDVLRNVDLGPGSAGGFGQDGVDLVGLQR